MDIESLPTIFISHGPPTLLLENIPAREFLKDLGKTYKNVNAVLCISAHWTTTNPTVNAIEKNDTIHDFYGFPSELYQVKYPALGAPELAQRTADLINNNGLTCEIDYTRGLDSWCMGSVHVDVPKFGGTYFSTFNTTKHGSSSTSLIRQSYSILKT